MQPKPSSSRVQTLVLMFGIVTFGGASALFALSADSPNTAKVKATRVDARASTIAPQPSLPASQIAEVAPVAPKLAAKPVPVTDKSVAGPQTIRSDTAAPVAPLGRLAKDIQNQDLSETSKYAPVLLPVVKVAAPTSTSKPVATPAPKALPPKQALTFVPQVERKTVDKVGARKLPPADLLVATPALPSIPKSFPELAGGAKIEAPSVSDAPKLSSKAVVEPTPKAVTATQSVSGQPTILMATEDRAWVRINDKKTVIVNKGQTLAPFGKFNGADNKNAKFESGDIAIQPNSKE